MNKQFQEDIKFAHKLKKEINGRVSKGEISISWIDLKEHLNQIISDRRKSLIKQSKVTDEKGKNNI